MKMIQLQIRTTPAKLAYNSQNASLEKEPSDLNILDIETSKPLLEIEQKHGKITIDQSECFNECGLKTISRLISDNSSYSKQKAVEGLSEMVDDGNEMADIVNTFTAISDRAYFHHSLKDIKEWNMVTMPRSKPNINFSDIDVKFNLREGSFNNNTRKRAINFNFKPQNLDIYLESRNEIEFSTIEIEL